MDISNLEIVLKSQETTLEAMLSSLSNSTKPGDIRKAINEHIARTNRIVRNAIPRITSPFKPPLNNPETSFAKAKSVPSTSTPTKNVTPSKTTPLKPGFKQRKPLFSPACTTPRKRAISSDFSEDSYPSDGSSPETMLEKQWIVSKYGNVSQESRQVEPSHRRRSSTTTGRVEVELGPEHE